MKLTLTDRIKRLDEFLIRAFPDIKANTDKMRNILYHDKSSNELLVSRAIRFENNTKEFYCELKLFRENLRKYERSKERTFGIILSFLPGTEVFLFKQKASHHLMQVEKLFNKLILTKLDIPQPKQVTMPIQKNDKKIFKSINAFFNRNKATKTLHAQPNVRENVEPKPRLRISPTH